MNTPEEVRLIHEASEALKEAIRDTRETRAVVEATLESLAIRADHVNTLPYKLTGEDTDDSR